MKIKNSKSIAEKTQDHMDVTNQIKNIFIIQLRKVILIRNTYSELSVLVLTNDNYSVLIIY